MGVWWRGCVAALRCGGVAVWRRGCAAACPPSTTQCERKEETRRGPQGSRSARVVATAAGWRTANDRPSSQREKLRTSRTTGRCLAVDAFTIIMATPPQTFAKIGENAEPPERPEHPEWLQRHWTPSDAAACQPKDRHEKRAFGRLPPVESHEQAPADERAAARTVSGAAVEELRGVGKASVCRGGGERSADKP